MSLFDIDTNWVRYVVAFPLGLAVALLCSYGIVIFVGRDDASGDTKLGIGLVCLANSVLTAFVSLIVAANTANMLTITAMAAAWATFAPAIFLMAVLGLPDALRRLKYKRKRERHS